MKNVHGHLAMEQRSLEYLLKSLPWERRSVKKFYTRINRILPLPKGATVLDIGAGAGAFVAATLELGYHCVGVEPWEEARLNAQKLSQHLNVPIEIVEGTAENIPYPDSTFDLVHARSVIEHVVNLKMAFHEIHRVLKPGGTFWFMAASSVCPRQAEIAGFPLFGWYPDSWKRKIMNWAKDARPELVGYTKTPAVNWFSPSKTRALLKSHGFSRVYDRWDLRGLDEGGPVHAALLTAIRSTGALKILAEVFVRNCIYAAVKTT
jgi:ubiquinone/menaquinone biosynthesis C-methylase UbiE